MKCPFFLQRDCYLCPFYEFKVDEESGDSYASCEYPNM